MKGKFILVLLLFLLTGCGKRAENTPPQEDPSQTLAAGSQVSEAADIRPERSEIRLTVQSKTEIRPVRLHAGQGYSIYIAEEGWRLKQDREDSGVLEDTWESVLHGDRAELQVQIYPDAAVNDAKRRFVAEEDDYRFESQLSGNWGDPIRGRDDEDREMLHFMVLERNGDSYIISWHYADAVADLYGAQLRQMANTFLLTEE